MSKLKIEYIPIDDIKTYENNAKLHPAEQIEQIKKSIQEFGFNDPIAIDENNVIIEGHGRYIACKELGINEVPIIRLNELDEEHKRAYMLVHNKLTMNSDFDIDTLNFELEEINLDMSDYGFEINEIEEEKEVEEVEVPEVPEEPKSKLGDIYQLGNHRLMCGDSTDVKQVEKLMNGEIASIEITSPPYNVGESSKLNGNTKMKESRYLNNDDNITEYDNLIDSSTINGIDNSKYAFINLQMLSNNKIDVIEYLYKFKEYLCDIGIWNKGYGAPAMAERVMNSAFEFVFIFSKENNSRAIGTKNFRGNIPNIFNIPPQRKNEYSGIHAATFPIEFPSFFVNNFTNANEIVLDLFGGTGTTLMACEQLDRNCYCMEIDPIYVDVIIQRWENYTGKKAVKLND